LITIAGVKENTAVFAPSATAREMIATSVNDGRLRSDRTA
jgi:hypothetical protein